MAEFFSSGRVADLVLVVLAVEALILAGRGRGRSRLTVLIAALPGAFLVLAVRAALTGADWRWTAFWLAAAFPAHLADLWRRPV